MRVLLIDSRSGGDWSLDLLYAGLVQNLGHENVVDFPSYDKRRLGPIALTGDPERDWGAERGSLSYVPGCASFHRWTEWEVLHEMRLGRIDLIFVDERPESYEIYLRLRANIFGEIPVVLVSGHDKFWNVSPQWVVANYYPGRVKATFLDNWRSEYSYVDRAHVYNWSINFDHLWTRPEKLPEKVYDISFMGYNSHPDRAMVVDHITRRWGHLRLNLVLERRPNSFDMFVPKSSYFDTMLRSHICLNLRGAAENGKTLRFYEIPYVGSTMLSQDTGAVQLHPFEPDRHCTYFRTLDELDVAIDVLLEEGWARDIQASRGHEHAMANHTSKRRVEEMLKVIRG